MASSSPLPAWSLRGRRLVLDSDLAAFYQVPTKRLMEQVRRHPARFPAEACFRLSLAEIVELRAVSPAGGSSTGRMGIQRRGLPHAFTLEGVILAAAVLSTPVAVAVSLMMAKHDPFGPSRPPPKHANDPVHSALREAFG